MVVDKLNIKISKLIGEDIKNLRVYYKLTWHECEDGFTAQLVPQAIHSTKFGGIPHLGGISIIKKYKEGMKILQAIRDIGV